MAKKVQISTDGGTNWNDLPGSQADFNDSAEGIDDTIFGQTFESMEVGLITWGITSNGVYKGSPGYNADIKKIGSPTAMTDEACSLESGLIYAIDDAAKEIWQRGSITVDDNAVLVADADIEWIDYLFGRIKFVTGYTVTGSITVSGNFYATTAIGKGQSYTLTMSADTKDTSDFATVQGNGGFRTFEPGLRTVTLEMNGVFDATEAAAADLAARTELICEIDPIGNGESIARGFFKVMTTTQSGAVGALEDETITFQLTVPEGDKVLDVFNWRHTNTTLAQAIQDALTSWLTELNTYDIRYLPQGAPGQSPTDGKTGKFVVTDISLSGGLSNMNVFNVETQGTGVVTTV